MLTLSLSKKYAALNKYHYQELFEQRAYDRRKQRIEIGIDYIPVSAPPSIVEDLANLGFTCNDYVNGIAVSPKGRIVKLGKVLNEKNLAHFVNDPLRALKEKKVKVVISRHPHDIIRMSLGRNWVTCMANLQELESSITTEILNGTLVAYLVDVDDNNIQNPYSRCLITPYFKRTKTKKEVVLKPIRYYGTACHMLLKTVEDFCLEFNSTKPSGFYTRLKSYYNNDIFFVVAHKDPKITKCTKVNNVLEYANAYANVEKIAKAGPLGLSLIAKSKSFSPTAVKNVVPEIAKHFRITSEFFSNPHYPISLKKFDTTVSQSLICGEADDLYFAFYLMENFSLPRTTFRGAKKEFIVPLIRKAIQTKNFLAVRELFYSKQLQNVCYDTIPELKKLPNTVFLINRHGDTIFSEKVLMDWYKKSPLNEEDKQKMLFTGMEKLSFETTKNLLKSSKLASIAYQPFLNLTTMFAYLDTYKINIRIATLWISKNKITPELVTKIYNSLQPVFRSDFKKRLPKYFRTFAK